MYQKDVERRSGDLKSKNMFDQLLLNKHYIIYTDIENLK